ncbi:MAG: ATP synthase F1 subunit delta [Planctomycetota bacterium]
MSSQNQVADPVASRWAHALHDLATRNGSLDAVRRDIAQLAAEVAVPKVREFLRQSSVPKAVKLRALEPLLQGMSKATSNAIRMAVERRREALLVNLPAAFQARENELSGVLNGVVESPRELGSSEVQNLEQSLTAKFHKKVVLTQRSNPDLVGGVRIFVGAHMIDRSVQGRLEMLASRLRHVPLSHS